MLRNNNMEFPISDSWKKFRCTKEKMDSPTPMKTKGTWNGLYPADGGNFYFCACKKITLLRSTRIGIIDYL